MGTVNKKRKMNLVGQCCLPQVKTRQSLKVLHLNSMQELQSIMCRCGPLFLSNDRAHLTQTPLEGYELTDLPKQSQMSGNGAFVYKVYKCVSLSH